MLCTYISLFLIVFCLFRICGFGFVSFPMQNLCLFCHIFGLQTARSNIKDKFKWNYCNIKNMWHAQLCNDIFFLHLHFVTYFAWFLFVFGDSRNPFKLELCFVSVMCVRVWWDQNTNKMQNKQKTALMSSR